jgi:hypothetical protein
MSAETPAKTGRKKDPPGPQEEIQEVNLGRTPATKFVEQLKSTNFFYSSAPTVLRTKELH